MQRGPLLQPFRSTELVLSGPPRARKLAGLSTGRLAHSHCLSFEGLIHFSLVPLRTPLCASPPARRGWPRCCASGPRRRAEWGLPQMVFLIAEYSNKRLVPNRAFPAVHAVSTRSRTGSPAGQGSFHFHPLHRRSKPTLWAGFPLGVCSAKASLLSQGEAPLRPASPFGEYASPLFPKAVTVSCCAETAPAPRFIQSLIVVGSLHP